MTSSPGIHSSSVESTMCLFQPTCCGSQTSPLKKCKYTCTFKTVDAFVSAVQLDVLIRWLTHFGRTEKDKSSPSPYLTINNRGRVEVQNDQVVVSSCRMQIHKFPFDIQKCNLSFRSIIYTSENSGKTF